VSRRNLIIQGILGVVLVVGSGVEAAEVKIFRGDSQSSVLAGTLEGLSVGPLGAVELARNVEPLATLDEPFVFSAAPHPKGWVVGTGNSGKVLLIDRQGVVSEVYAAEESEVFAVWADDDGAVLAATSPNGKVYRIADGAAEVAFETEASYIWDLARDSKGRLLVATGLPGRLLRVDANGKSETLYESPDSHVRSIALQAEGGILVGTAGQGLIVRIDDRGEVKTLHDAAHPEVLDIVTSEDGTAFAAVVASEASFVDLSKSSSSANDSTEGDEAETATVTDDVGTVGSSRFRKTVKSKKGSNSRVIRSMLFFGWRVSFGSGRGRKGSSFVGPKTG